MTEYVRVDITEAQECDEMRQAGQWAVIANVTFPTEGMVTVWWASGGSHTIPTAHRPAVRRYVGSDTYTPTEEAFYAAGTAALAELRTELAQD